MNYGKNTISNLAKTIEFNKSCFINGIYYSFTESLDKYSITFQREKNIFNLKENFEVLKASKSWNVGLSFAFLRSLMDFCSNLQKNNLAINLKNFGLDRFEYNYINKIYINWIPGEFEKFKEFSQIKEILEIAYILRNSQNRKSKKK